MFSRKTTDLIKFLKSFANKQRSVIFVFLVILNNFLRKKKMILKYQNRKTKLKKTRKTAFGRLPD